MGSKFFSVLSGVIGIGATLGLGCAAPSDGEWEMPENLPPRASLRAPVIAPMGQPVIFDASASYDPEGGPLTYIFDFNDGGSPLHSDDPVVQHIFHQARPFTVRVRAIDIYDLSGSAIQDVSVRSEYPDPPDFCEILADCVVGDECILGVCYAVGGGLD